MTLNVMTLRHWAGSRAWSVLTTGHHQPRQNLDIPHHRQTRRHSYGLVYFSFSRTFTQFLSTGTLVFLPPVVSSNFYNLALTVVMMKPPPCGIDFVLIKSAL